MLKLENVSKYYNTEGNVSLGLRNVNVELKKNEIVAIVGESGSGKTTFLNVVSGNDTYENGEMFFNGEPTSYYSASDMEKYRKNNVGFIFQNYNLVESYTVLQNVMTMLQLKGFTRKEAKKRSLELIEKVGLYKRRHNKATKLSGGEKQRCVIARALASDPLILACDEPTGNLDSKTGAEIINLIKEISKDKLVLIVTHNYDEVKDIATRKLRFFDGELVEDSMIKETQVESSEIEEKEPYKVKVRDSLLIALRNIFATPKKTIFIFAVLLVLSMVIGALYENVTSSDFLNNNYRNNDFRIENRVFFTSENIDTEKLTKLSEKYLVTYNDFYSNYRFRINFKQDSKTEAISSYIDYTERNNSTLSEGRFPKNKSEIVICSDFIYSFDNYRKFSDIENMDVNLGGKNYTIVGLSNNQYSYLTKDSIPFLKEIFLNNYYPSFTCNVGIIFFNIDDSLENKKLIINIPKSMEKLELNDMQIEINQQKFNVNLSLYDRKNVVVDSFNGFSITMNSKTLNDMVYENAFFGSVFVNDKTEIAKVISEVNALGYSAYDASKVATVYGLDYYFSFFQFILTMCLCIFGFFVIYFISYLVLSFVISSKKKDYVILRTLGFNKTNMRRVVSFENLFIMTSAYLFFIIIDIVVYAATSHKVDLVSFVTSFKIAQILMVYVILIILSLLLSRRFNRRIFKLSVNQSLKKGEM